jgi:hypothetical protein
MRRAGAACGDRIDSGVTEGWPAKGHDGRADGGPVGWSGPGVGERAGERGDLLAQGLGACPGLAVRRSDPDRSCIQGFPTRRRCDKGRAWLLADSPAGPLVGGCGSARRPEAEFLGVEYRPDVLDPAACHVERIHRHGDAISLSYQAGLTVDRTLEERHGGGRLAGEVDEEVGDLLAAFDRVGLSAGEATAVAGRRGVRVEKTDEGIDVCGFPRLSEVRDEAGLPGRRSRGSLCGADTAAGCGGQLAACRRGTAGDLGDVGEGVAKDVVQDERDALGRSHRFEYHEEGHVDRLVEGDPVGRVDRFAWPSAHPFRGAVSSY